MLKKVNDLAEIKSRWEHLLKRKANYIGVGTGSIFMIQEILP
jgi:hypothetical protein